MSYLDLPRLHFSGLFYTGPSTINNITQNYTPTVDLESGPNQYDRSVAGWDPTGVAQWWLEECTVLSAVSSGATPVAAGDAVIGAAVETPSPKTPMSDGQGGFYDIAKMVDLDPDQQGRSALYGVRISVVLPNGAGLQGLMTVPELRQLNGRIPARGSWAAVGNWMGTLQEVQWSGDISSSPFLTALKAAAAQGLAVKLTVDLHRNNPANVFTAGDMFCYGRVLGSIGPVLPGELAQVVPGRCLQTTSVPPTPAQAPAIQPVIQMMQRRETVAAATAALAEMREALTSNAAMAPLHAWHPAFSIVRQVGAQSLLSIDIGGSIFLQVQNTANGPVADGTFEVDSDITLGVVNLSNQQFVPFANGAITFTNPDQYQPLVSTSKNCVLVKNSGVFTIPLTSDDVNIASANPLAIQVNGTTVVQESPSGLWMDVSVSSERLECGSGANGQAQIMVRQFGNPLANQMVPVTAMVQVFPWIFYNGQWAEFPPYQVTPPSSGDLGISIGTTDANGIAQITTSVNVEDITLPVIRQPLDSQIYYISLYDFFGNIIGDHQTTLSVLLWKPFQAPTNPSWSDIGAIFSAYARLYPGMKSRLDISNQQTVIGFAPVIEAMMSKDIGDPGYMPVTRDMSPSKMKMIVSWLKSVAKPAAGTGSR
jgi:hypothetical protein